MEIETTIGKLDSEDPRIKRLEGPGYVELWVDGDCVRRDAVPETAGQKVPSKLPPFKKGAAGKRIETTLGIIDEGELQRLELDGWVEYWKGDECVHRCVDHDHPEPVVLAEDMILTSLGPLRASDLERREGLGGVEYYKDGVLVHRSATAGLTGVSATAHAAKIGPPGGN